MSNLESSFRDDPEALIDLLEAIVASYQDNDSRPDDALSLYWQRVQLGANYQVKLAKRFVVVEGGAVHRRSRHEAKRDMKIGQPRLKLVARTAPLVITS